MKQAKHGKLTDPLLDFYRLLLFTTYFFLFFSQSIAAVIFLAPWEETREDAKPLIGTWQRSLNDFALDGGIPFFGLLIISASVYFLISNKKEKEGKSQKTNEFAILNLIYIILNLLFIYIVIWITKQSDLTPEAGFHQTIGLFAYLILTTSYLYFCAKINSHYASDC